jgi:hypothetical protein
MWHDDDRPGEPVGHRNERSANAAVDAAREVTWTTNRPRREGEEE